MLGSEDITGLLGGRSPDGSPFRQGTVVTFNTATGANTVSVAGGVLTNVPIAENSGVVNLAPGDVVILLKFQSSWCILGRIIPAGGGDFAAASLAVARDATSATNFSVSTTLTTKTSFTLPVPAWANRASVIGSTLFSIKNTDAVDHVCLATMEVDGATSGGGQFFCDINKSRHGIAQGTWDITPGGATISVTARILTSATTVPADANNSVILSALAIFRRV